MSKLVWHTCTPNPEPSIKPKDIAGLVPRFGELFYLDFDLLAKKRMFFGNKNVGFSRGLGTRPHAVLPTVKQ